MFLQLNRKDGIPVRCNTDIIKYYYPENQYTRIYFKDDVTGSPSIIVTNPIERLDQILGAINADTVASEHTGTAPGIRPREATVRQ